MAGFSPDLSIWREEVRGQEYKEQTKTAKAEGLDYFLTAQQNPPGRGLGKLIIS